MITEGRCSVCGAVGAMLCEGGDVVCANEAACGRRLRAGSRRGQDGDEQIATDERDALEWVAVAARAYAQSPVYRSELSAAFAELDRVRAGVRAGEER